MSGAECAGNAEYRERLAFEAHREKQARDTESSEQNERGRVIDVGISGKSEIGDEVEHTEPAALQGQSEHAVLFETRAGVAEGDHRNTGKGCE